MRNNLSQELADLEEELYLLQLQLKDIKLSDKKAKEIRNRQSQIVCDIQVIEDTLRLNNFFTNRI